MPTILVADDYAGVRQLIKTLLKEDGYQVLEAGDGQRVLELVQQEHPALVILDRLMPGLTGDQVVTELRANPATRELPVVLMTGDSNTDVQGYMFSVRVSAFLHKPFDPSELLKIVKQLLGEATATA
jgi:CheY-like chemotaxis protein